MVYMKKYKLILVLLFVCGITYAQEPTVQDSGLVPDGTQGEMFRQPTEDSVTHKLQMKLNEFDGPLASLKFGGGIMYEYAGFSQDEESKSQVSPEAGFKVRDARFTMSGKFKTKREITYKLGLMYDVDDKTWFLRESGVMIKLKEARGHVFIGRTKEGYSLSKVMVGYAIWHFERNTSIDIIPILADGIKYIGYLPKSKIIWNVGMFTDWLSEGQSFSTYQYQFASRVGWLPVYTDTYKPVLHIGASYRYGKVKDGSIRVRSKPEVSGGPYYVDSDVFNSDHSNSFGGELYYRHGKFTFGSEYHIHKFSSSEKGNPEFGGGEAFVAYMFTGEVKPYYTFNGIFGFIKVKRPLFQGGWGALEGMLRITNMDIDDQLIEGGKYWRFTPMVNWFLNDHVRIFMNYGYTVLDRYNTEGKTHIFQTRVLFSI